MVWIILANNMLSVCRQLAVSKQPRTKLWQMCQKIFWTQSWGNWWETPWFCQARARSSTEQPSPDTSWGSLTVLYSIIFTFVVPGY